MYTAEASDVYVDADDSLVVLLVGCWVILGSGCRVAIGNFQNEAKTVKKNHIHVHKAHTVKSNELIFIVIAKTLLTRK